MSRFIQQGMQVKEPDPEPLKLGSEIWTIDPRDRRKGWEMFVITSETRLSWMAQKKGHNWHSRKISKATMLENHGPQWGQQRWYTPADKDARQFIDKHRQEIAKRVGNEWNEAGVPLTEVAAQLKKIAEILGMELTCNPPN